MTSKRSLFLLSGILLAATSLLEAAEISKLTVYPSDVELSTKRDFQNLIVVATRDDGVTIDVTRDATLTLEDESLCRLDNNRLLPVKDGETRLAVEYLGHEASASVKVTDAQSDRDVSFALDVMPVFMRSGCNTGSCHGAARGKDGFRLSLFGFDPQGDYFRVTREIGVRRINLAMPEASLLVEKSIGSVPHTGGKRFDEGSVYHETVMRWLRAGAPADEKAPPKITQVDVFPSQVVIEGEGSTQQFIARAHYDDGTSRDVTNLAVFMTSNDNSAPIDADGKLTAKARGEAFVMARFETHTVGSQVLVLPRGLDYKAPKIAGNYLDELVGEKLQKVRLLPSELCTDEEFLRRVTIDISGKLPTSEEYHAFLSDTSGDKRAKLVDRLLERKEFSEIWAMKWAEQLMIKSSNRFSYKSAILYNTWLSEQIANDVPLDEMVRNLLASTGGTFKSPQTNFYQIERSTLKTAENVAQVFMGIRTQCAQCHNHPFDRWTMDDYYSFAAFFAQIGRKTGEDYREQVIYNRGSGDVKHIVGGKTMAPKFLGGDAPDTKGKDRRQVLAEWLTAPENPYFAKSIANRVWAHFFGKGIVEPVDDIRVSNPPSNPALFDTLGAKLVAYNYDFKQLVRDICNSHAYQRSAVRNENNQNDERNFAHALVRRIPAESLLDCICQVTKHQEKFRGLPLGAKATQIADGRTSTYFLTTFGRAKRETVCACEATTDPSLSQALHMLNGSTIGGKVTAGGLIKTLLAEDLTITEVIESIYIRCLTRKPTAEESDRLSALVKDAPDVQAGLEDVFWAVLNSREFVFNH